MTAPTALHWFTSDLRVDDNPALSAAPANVPIVGVFVVDPACRRRHAEAQGRWGFLDACLVALDRDLRTRGSRLVVLEGDPMTVLPRAATRWHARVVTHASNVEPAARRRESTVARALVADGVEVRSADASSVHATGSITKSDGSPYRVYSAFARAWMAQAVRSAVAPPGRWVPACDLEGFGWSPAATAISAGTAVAHARLDAFLAHGLADYATRRDLPALDGTSRLSAHLRFGTLSAATCVRRARDRAGAGAWIRELAWRDFFAHVLHANPKVATVPMRPLRIAWREAPADLARWESGTTGIPLVDAGMRELTATGFMHNRVRMITASFLTRHLLIDWQLGERHFMRHLHDGALSQNNGNWQWVAGTGTDAQPFHRIFSPVRQGERFDADGAYVKRWVPELLRVSAGAVHAPWTLSPLERRAQCPDYPPPMIDLAEGRARALAAFSEARRQPSQAARRS